MRFMMFMILPVDHHSETGGPWDLEMMGEMTKFNQKLIDSGALISLDGLHPTSKAARIVNARGISTVTDGPFTEAKEVIGGYWMINASSREEAIEWAKQVPDGEGVVEIRQVFEMSDFPAELQEAAR